MMIDHITCGVRDIQKSAAFYDAVLGTLGYKRVFDETDEGGRLVAVGYGVDRPVFWVNLPMDETREARASNGSHIAFRATSQEQVHAFFDVAVANGGADDGAPGPRPHYHEHYYAAFVYDPEGNHVEVVFGNS